MAAHVAAGYPKPFVCGACVWGRHCDASRPAPFPQWSIVYYGERIFEGNTCPLPTVPPWARELTSLYRHFKHSVFPFAGGLLEQPAFYKRAMEILDGVFAEIESERVKRAQRETR